MVDMREYMLVGVVSNRDRSSHMFHIFVRVAFCPCDMQKNHVKLGLSYALVYQAQTHTPPPPLPPRALFPAISAPEDRIVISTSPLKSTKNNNNNNALRLSLERLIDFNFCRKGDRQERSRQICGGKADQQGAETG